MEQAAEQHTVAHETCGSTSGRSGSETCFGGFGDPLKMHIVHYCWWYSLLLVFCQEKATFNPEEEKAWTGIIQSAKASFPRVKYLNA